MVVPDNCDIIESGLLGLFALVPKSSVLSSPWISSSSGGGGGGGRLSAADLRPKSKTKIKLFSWQQAARILNTYVNWCIIMKVNHSHLPLSFPFRLNKLWLVDFLIVLMLDDFWQVY